MKKIIIIAVLMFGMNLTAQDSTIENLKKEFPISVSGFKLSSNSLPGGSSVIYSYECKVTITNLSENTIDKAVFSEIVSIELPSGTEQLDTRYTHILNGDKWYPNESKTILIKNALMDNREFITKDYFYDYNATDFVLKLVFKASNKFGYSAGYRNPDYNVIYKDSFPFRIW